NGCRFLKAPMAQQSKNSGLLQTIPKDGFQKTEIMSTQREPRFQRSFKLKKLFNRKWNDLTELVYRGNSQRA
ncbi:hypothetical protein ACEN2T_11000, partial [Pseudomonas sp. W22_MBD1_FP4]|uniref:hypothetical protein n=1 Tax=Pseudomonas sp. W22_MBD1_FP4 TaxID=3240272 RepID=UPI003F98E389